MLAIIAGLYGSAIGFMLWGLYTCLFIATVWAARVRGMDKITSPVMVAVIALYVMNLILNAIDLATLYWVQIPTAVPHNVAWSVLITFWDAGLYLSMLTADSLLSWRLGVIWMYDYRVMVIPDLVILAQLGSSIALVVFDILITIFPWSDARMDRYRRAGATATYLSLGLTLYNTTIIVIYLWRADSQLKSCPDESGIGRCSQYTKIILALVESGCVYTLFLIGYIAACSVKESAVQVFFTNSVPIIIGIAPTLIQLQRSLGYLQPSEIPASMAEHLSKGTTIRFAGAGTHGELSTHHTQTDIATPTSNQSVLCSSSPTDEKVADLV